MEIRTRIVPRVLQFKTPAQTSRGVYTLKKVWYVIVTGQDEGKQFLGIGECAPLFDLSPDFSEDYEKTLLFFCKEVERSHFLDKEKLRNYPSILFGLETALLSAKASLQGDYLKLYDTPFSNGLNGIPINGLIWMGKFEEMRDSIDKKLADGFNCIKLKIGAIDFNSEIELIKKIRTRYSQNEIEIRVDANGAFAPREALEKLHVLAKYDIHSIEQPIKAGNYSECRKLCAESPLPIALDEELIGVYSLKEKQQLLDFISPQYIVIKPTLHGGLSGSEEWIEEAKKRGIRHWITSALESNVGLNAIAQWNSQEHILSDMHQGLGTGLLFEKNFNDTRLQIENGLLWIGEKDERDFTKTLSHFKERWYDSANTMAVHTSGSTGKPKNILVEKEKMKASAHATISYLGIKKNDTALLCLPLSHIGGQMMVVRALQHQLHLILRRPSSRPLSGLRQAPDFVAMTPLQVIETLQHKKDKRLLHKVKHLIIGGGAVHEDLKKELKKMPGNIWSTYGMTETLSHIALQRINGENATERYTPLPGVKVSLAPNKCLEITAPHICNTKITTNDLAEIWADGTFKILGRIDNMICSGTLKFQIEVLEEKLQSLNYPFLITSVFDKKLGEAITLLYEGHPSAESEIRDFCKKILDKYEIPRYYINVGKLPYTTNGKPSREKAKNLANKLIKTQ